jgi:CRISPR/Cas system Type II protein with McrA/HNH and RuvC-like nuclease domain
VNASSSNLSVNSVLNELLKSPITFREIKESKNIYKEILNKEGKVYCVWTGKEISTFDVDHMIPFSIWKNNDLWNLLPSDSRINNQKRDKIPLPEIIERQKHIILDYWSLIYESQAQRFQKEIQVSLLGNHSFDSWRNLSISQLQNSCDYLIEKRGFEGWKI